MPVCLLSPSIEGKITQKKKTNSKIHIIYWPCSMFLMFPTTLFKYTPTLYDRVKYNACSNGSFKHDCAYNGLYISSNRHVQKWNKLLSVQHCSVKYNSFSIGLRLRGCLSAFWQIVWSLIYVLDNIFRNPVSGPFVIIIVYLSDFLCQVHIFFAVYLVSFGSPLMLYTHTHKHTQAWKQIPIWCFSFSLFFYLCFSLITQKYTEISLK